MTGTQQTSDEGRRPVRVMRIIARLNIGGPAIHVSLLTAGINDAEFASTLVTGQIGPGEGDMSYLASDYGITPIDIPGLGREISPLDDIRAFLALLRLIRQERPQIVHTHTAKAGFLGRTAAALCRVPVVVHTFHGHVFRGYFGPVKTRVFIVLERIAARMSSVILTVSDRLRDDLIDFGIAPPNKIEVVSLGLDLAPLTRLADLRGELRKELAIAPTDPLIGIVGRLVSIKNHRMFLEAASQVVRQMPEARLLVVGDGELRPELQALADTYSLSQHLSFVGWRRDLPRIYADLDVLALTSENEGTPVSIIEAMAAQVPVVATAVGGVPDLLQNGALGRLIPPGDTAALAAAVTEIIKAGKNVECLHKAQQVALEQYGSDRLIGDLKKLYRRLLDQAGIPAGGD